MDFLNQLVDIVIYVLEPQAQGDMMRRIKKKPHMSKSNIVKPLIEGLDFVPPNARTSSQRASLFIFEDNDAVIKMTIKGLAMEHVSLFRRVDLCCLFDRMNLDDTFFF